MECECSINKVAYKALKVNLYGSLIGFLCFILQYIFRNYGMLDWENWARITSSMAFVEGAVAILLSIIIEKTTAFKRETCDFFKSLKKHFG